MRLSAERSPYGQSDDGRAGTAQAATGQPETGQTPRRYIGPKGERRPDGEKRRAVGRRAPTCG